MSKVAVVYWSSTGNTEAMANAVADGIREKGGEAVLHTCEDFDGSKVAEYDAIAFGCPAMGDEVLEESEFEPFFTAIEGALSGKTIALFGSYGWGDGEWMRNWEERAHRIKTTPKQIQKSGSYGKPYGLFLFIDAGETNSFYSLRFPLFAAC